MFYLYFFDLICWFKIFFLFCFSDGGYEMLLFFGKYCGLILLFVIVFYSNSLWMKFVSDVYGMKIGFLVYWDGMLMGKMSILSSGLFDMKFIVFFLFVFVVLFFLCLIV